MDRLLKVFVIWLMIFGTALAFVMGNSSTSEKPTKSPVSELRDGQIVEKLDDGKTQYLKVYDSVNNAYLIYSVDYTEWKLYKVGEIY